MDRQQAARSGRRILDRRDLVALLGGAAIATPHLARAQPKALPAIGYLGIGSPPADNIRGPLGAFRQSLEEAGYREGRDVTTEYRWAEDQYDRLPVLATDLVRRHVAVIVAPGLPAASAAKQATSTTPIVFILGTDPVQTGFVRSLSRPGGNATGVAILASELMAKRVELLRELLPALAIVAFLDNPANPNVGPEATSLREGARSLGLEIHPLQASMPPEIDTAFESLDHFHAGALVVSSDPFFTNQRAQIVALAARQAVPAIYAWRLFPAAGGLISYGPDIADAYRQLGVLTAKILGGAKPTELPVQQVVKLELVINLKTAKAIGLTVPPAMLARADEVIE